MNVYLSPILYAPQNPKAIKKIIRILEKERLTEKEVDTLTDVVDSTKQVDNLREEYEAYQNKPISRLHLWQEQTRRTIETTYINYA
ncbi:hypothetical protein KAU55_01610 [Candidatus Bathyarchaeota archaeon]|nr:hypothetical protein [Candidatus Bathyarchaeota archaeon]